MNAAMPVGDEMFIMLKTLFIMSKECAVTVTTADFLTGRSPYRGPFNAKKEFVPDKFCHFDHGFCNTKRQCNQLQVGPTLYRGTVGPAL